MLRSEFSAKIDGFGSHFGRNSGGKLHGSQYPQRILGEAVRAVTKPPVLQIRDSTKRIENLFCHHIKIEGVDGEIPSESRLTQRHVRADVYLETLVSGPRFALASGEPYIDWPLAQFVDPKTFSDFGI